VTPKLPTRRSLTRLETPGQSWSPNQLRAQSPSIGLPSTRRRQPGANHSPLPGRFRVLSENFAFPNGGGEAPWFLLLKKAVPIIKDVAPLAMEAYKKAKMHLDETGSALIGSGVGFGVNGRGVGRGGKLSKLSLKDRLN